MTKLTAQDLNSCLPYVFGTEFEYIKTLGAELPPQAKVLMLGCGPGIMALLLHEGATQPFHFSCIDSGDFYTYIKHMQAAGFTPGMMYQGLTKYNAYHFPDESLDLLIVDASHTYENVKEDIQLYWPKVKIGGRVLFHDFVDKELNGTNGVAEAIRDSKDEHWQLIATPGISIVFKKV